jgi:histidine ammonia-lyase
MASNFLFGEDKLTVSAALDLVNGRRKGILSEVAKERILKGEQHVRAIVDQGSTVYGINTGFGILANTRISKEDTRLLQEKILQSHSVGVGSAIPTAVAKLMLITKVHALSRGYSGVQLSTLVRIIWHIDNDCIPVVPEKG